ncbi:hypothetical protein LX36DRAFT_644161 [Colletotrichum falcatum]|nr:hypothetical protein LX36DRAFT_644161 [Colletotrichum falcatum]
MSVASGQFAGDPRKVTEAQELIRDFFQDINTHHATALDESSLRAFLKSDKTCSPRPSASDYLDDHDAKAVLIPKVKGLVTAANYEELDQAAFWAALWTMPITDIEAMYDNACRSEDAKRKLRRQLTLSARQLPKITRIFRGLVPQIPETPNGDNRNAPKYSRNQSEVDSALRRDNHKCVITDTANPEACHIFPFAPLKQKNQRELDLIISGGHDTPAVDTMCNMICLSPQLHDWWTRGYFALEPISVSSEPTSGGTPKWSIDIRFHWLRKTDVPTLTSHVDFSQDPVAKLQDLKGEGGGLVKIFNATTGRLVENGQIFTITADSRDEIPDFDILLLQWDLLRMWRLAGGADPTIYPLDDDYDDDDDARVPVSHE